jgi:diadenosine tetraphosphate (Ap4A) HIT family hydrolase
VPSYELYRRYDADEDDGIMAILDIHPATRGHVLVIPKRPARTWLQLGLIAHQQASSLTYMVAKRQEDVLGVETVTPANFGEQVPHVHYHSMPSYEPGDTIHRMHPDSGRMQEPIDHDDLSLLREQLAFPPELAAEADAQLAHLSRFAIHLF